MRHKPLIAIWRRIFREAGINIPQRDVEKMLCRTHVRRGPNDRRRMDLVTSGIDGIYGGAPLFMDVTIVSPLHSNGHPMPGSSNKNGAAIERAEARHRNVDYPDLEASPLVQLLSLGVETYGRWSDHCLGLVKHLAKFKSKNLPEHVQRAMECGYYSRWWNILSISVQNIVCESILRSQVSDLLQAAEHVHHIPVEDILEEHR